MLSVKSLGKTYRTGVFNRRPPVRVLDDVSFDVRAGEIVGLVGANGVGKTTILHAIAGLLKADGSIWLDSEPLTPARAQRRVALCGSADRSFYYRLTLADNLRFFGRLQGAHGKELERAIERALAQTDLVDVADCRYSSCSTGTRQRLTFARALLCDAPVFLLDEPTRAVDPLHAQTMHAFIRNELAGRMRKAIVLATNLLDEAWSVCDRVVLLSAGRTVAVDTPDALKTRFSKRVRYRIELEREDTALYTRLGEYGSVQRVAENRIDFELPAGGQLDGVLLELVRSEAAVTAISAQGPSPDELFNAGRAS